MRNTGWEVHIGQPDILQRSIRFSVVQYYSDNSVIVLSPRGVMQRVDALSAELPEDFWWSVPVDAAPAILAAFSRHLGAVEHPQQLRADYEFERARSTKLIDTIIAIAEKRK